MQLQFLPPACLAAASHLLGPCAQAQNQAEIAAQQLQRQQ